MHLENQGNIIGAIHIEKGPLKWCHTQLKHIKKTQAVNYHYYQSSVCAKILKRDKDSARHGRQGGNCDCESGEEEAGPSKGGANTDPACGAKVELRFLQPILPKDIDLATNC